MFNWSIFSTKKCSRTLERRTKGAPPGKNDDQQNVAHNMNWYQQKGLDQTTNRQQDRDTTRENERCSRNLERRT